VNPDMKIVRQLVFPPPNSPKRTTNPKKQWTTTTEEAPYEVINNTILRKVNYLPIYNTINQKPSQD
jgi:hypothetical protein